MARRITRTMVEAIEAIEIRACEDEVLVFSQAERHEDVRRFVAFVSPGQCGEINESAAQAHRGADGEADHESSQHGLHG